MTTSSPKGAIPDSSLVDPKTLMTIRNLELRAKVVVEGFWNGIHRSPYHGFSVEFTEYRQYTPDDDPRYLDWRVYARSDRYFIKKFEDETNLRCYLLLDNSRSMAYGAGDFTKSDYARTLAATLGYFLYLQGDAIGLLTFDQQIREHLPARHRTGHLRQIMLALEKPAQGQATDLEPALERVVEMVRKRGLVIFISDFLAPLDGFERQFIALSASGHELMLFQVLDPTEMNFGFDRVTLFQDIESGRSLFIDPAVARGAYEAKFRAHSAALQALCEKTGAAFKQLTTETPLELALFDLLRSRMQRQTAARRYSRQAGHTTARP